MTPKRQFDIPGRLVTLAGRPADGGPFSAACVGAYDDAKRQTPTTSVDGKGGSRPAEFDFGSGGSVGEGFCRIFGKCQEGDSSLYCHGYRPFNRRPDSDRASIASGERLCEEVERLASGMRSERAFVRACVP